MGTVVEKLTYLNGTKSSLKTAINNLGGDIDNNTTFRQYANVLNDIYSNLPKVSDTGLNVSLSPTLKGRLDSELNGNTYQKTYTGKNLMPNNKTSGTSNGITFTPNEDGTYLINGKNNSSTANSYIYIYDTAEFNLSAGSYYCISTGDSNCGITMRAFYEDGTSAYVDLVNTSSITLPKNVIRAGFYIQVRKGTETTYDNFKIYPILSAEPVTIDNYEPYVGGIPAPNPDYPQEIQNATGTQNVVVSGKNLANIPDGTYSKNGINVTITNGKIKINGTSTAGASIPISNMKLTEAGTYTISCTPSISSYGNNLQIGGYVYNANGSYKCNIDVRNANKTQTIANGEYITNFWIYVPNGNTINNVEVYVQLEKGSTATDYEPYQTPQEVQLDLISKNLFNIKTAVQSSYGYHNNTGTLTHIDDNTIKIVKGEINTDKRMSVANDVNLLSGENICISWEYGENNGNVISQIQALDNNNNVVNLVSLNNNGLTSPQTLTLSTNIKYIWLGTSWANHNDLVVKNIQLEKGSTATEYEQYYNYELCKSVIGDYQDKIRKSTGKNKAKFTNCNVSGVGYSLTINNNEIFITTQETNNNFDLTGGLRTGNWEQSFSNTTDYNLTPADLGTYTCKMFVEQLSGSGSANSNFLVITNQRVITTYFKPTTTSEIKNTFTLNADEHIKQIAMWTNGTTSINLKCKVQLEKSQSATEYEPYGKVWYLHKETGKVNIDTSQITLRGSYSNIEYALIPKATDYAGYNKYGAYSVYCNKSNFSSNPSNWDSADNVNKIYSGAEVLSWWMGFSKGTGLNNIKNALVDSYIIYPLLTPTDTEIIDTTLINQLEQLYNLKSYDDTTNIDTSGNLPVVITASAIKGE